MRTLTDAERRTRLITRHALHPAHQAADPEAATQSVAVLHATEPATVFLSWQARTPATVEEMSDVLYEQRSVVKQLAMRRTLFGFPRDLVPAALGSASRAIADRLERQLIRDVVTHQIAPDGQQWVDRAREAVLALLSDGVPRQAAAIREAVAEVSGQIVIERGKAYDGAFQLAPRVLSWLAARGELMRGRNAGHWRTSRPEWVLTEDWLGEVTPLAPDEGYAAIVTAYLRSFGPARLDDVVWWLGLGVGVAKRALADIGAVEVGLDEGTGWVVPGDDADTEPVSAAAVLLPVLDPTVMGWKTRDFYLGDLAPQLFDVNGNAGTTAWWDGRVVGTWVQDPSGVVHVVPLTALPAEAREGLDVQADRLTRWLDGVVVNTVYPSPAMKAARARWT